MINASQVKLEIDWLMSDERNRITIVRSAMKGILGVGWWDYISM